MMSRRDGFRRSAVAGSIGAAIGAVVGGLLSSNYVYAAIAAIGGGILGELLILLLPNYSWKGYARAKDLTNLVFAVVSLLMAIAGVLGFFKTGNWVLALGALFFLGCGAFLVTHRE